MGLVKKDKHGFKVRKSNDLVEAKFKLPLIEQRILAICISKINPTKESLENPYRFSVDEYCELTSSDPRGMHETIRNAVDSLKSRNLSKYDPDLKRERIYGWLDKADIWDNGKVDIYIHPELASDLLAKKQYAEYVLKNCMNFSSKYTLRFFELFRSWSYLGRKQVEITNLREMIGIDEGEYIRYTDFKKRVIGKSLSEINEKTELNIEIHEFRKNRKVSIVEFVISSSAPSLKKVRENEKRVSSESVPKIDEYLNQSEEDKVIEKMAKFGVGATVSLKLIQDFGLEKVSDGIKEADADFKLGKVKEGVSLAGVIINKIKDPTPSSAPGHLVTTAEDLESRRSVLLEWCNREQFDYEPYHYEGNFTGVQISGKVINFMNPDFQEEFLGTKTI